MATDKKKKCLKHIDLFKKVDETTLKKIESWFLVKEYKPGEIVIKPEDRGRTYIVKKGKVELYQVSDEGKKFITELIGTGYVFGDMGTHPSTKRFVESIDNSIIYSIDRNKFFNLVATIPKFAEELVSQLDSRLMAAHEKEASLATDNVDRRFIRLLLTLGKTHQSSYPNQIITDKFTHEHLAQMLGVSRQTVTIIINNLKRKGFLRRVKKKFVINKTKIEKLLD